MDVWKCWDLESSRGWVCERGWGGFRVCDEGGGEGKEIKGCGRVGRGCWDGGCFNFGREFSCFCFGEVRWIVKIVKVWSCWNRSWKIDRISEDV